MRIEQGPSCASGIARWAALAEFMKRNALDTRMGSASIGMRDGGHVAASLRTQLRGTQLASIDWQVRPPLPLPVEQPLCDLACRSTRADPGAPALGAKVLGPPAWDPAFNTADLSMLICLADLPPRCEKHSLGR